MSIDYQIILTCSASNLFHDEENVEALGQRLESMEFSGYSEHFAHNNWLKDTLIYFCGYVKNLRVEEFLKAVNDYHWSDWLTIQISANSDPFELYIGRVAESRAQEY